MLLANPLLALLGRSGRGAVVEVLRRNPRRVWSVRELARFADVPPMVASRAARELAALGAVESFRPGRDARLRFRPQSPAGRWLARVQVPDLRAEAAAVFAAAYPPAAGVSWVGRWTHPDEDPASPLSPLRIALLARDPSAALDAAGPALDAVREAGYASPEVSAWLPDQVQGEGSVAAAIRAGVRIGPTPSG